MPAPIGYEPPANPYGDPSASPIAPMYHGMQPISPDVPAEMQQKIDKSEAYDTQAAQAAKFQKLLASGQAGMQSYIQDVGKDNPELAKQFQQEFVTAAPFMQGLKGKDLTDFGLNIFDSWNGRYNGAKLGKVIDQPGVTDNQVLGAYAKTGGHADKVMSAYEAGKRTDAQAPWYQARGNEANARAERDRTYGDLRIKLEKMREAAKHQDTILKATKDNTGFQLSYNDAKTKVDETQKLIDAWSASDPAAGGDPSTGQPYPAWQQNMIRENVGWNKGLNDLIQRQDKWRKYMDETTSHGARPDQPVPLKNPDFTAAPAAAPTSADSDDVWGKWLNDNTNYKNPTPDIIKQAKEAKRAAEAGGK